MCCLFGIVDYHHSLTAKQKNRVLSVLATACEARGTDATGIAYNSGGTLRIYKRPLPGHQMRFKAPKDAAVFMGHTRMTTQGDARNNRNNHPFAGNAAGAPFALAHNGILYNDDTLRRSLALPDTDIETDSYVAVQLIEKKRALDFSSLRYMAEKVRGSFTFTVLDGQDNLYFVKGDNPLCLYHYPKLGLYLYASTEDILKAALKKVKLRLGDSESVALRCGEILRINAEGKVARSHFDDLHLFCGWYASPWQPYYHTPIEYDTGRKKTHLDEVKSVAMAFGFAPEDIDRLAEKGFTAEELEELLYCGDL